jgi:protein O-mannosyl-transferase
VRTGTCVRTELWQLLCYAIASFGSLLSHEIGILTLPMTCLLLYAAAPMRGSWICLAAIRLAVDSGYLQLRHAAGGHLSSGTPLLSGLGIAFWKYVGWMLLPLGMSIERSTDVPANDPPMMTVAAFIGLLALLIAILQLRNKEPQAVAGLV